MKRGNFLIGFLFTAALGTLLHFVYEWTGENAFVGLFSAVNESTWEHLKLLYVPLVAFGVYEFICYGKNYCCFFPAKLIGILGGMLFITVFFYTYRGILGYNIDFLNISDFYLGAAVAWRVQYKFFYRPKGCLPISGGAALLGIIILGVLFAVFTYSPPTLGLFADPAKYINPEV